MHQNVQSIVASLFCLDQRKLLKVDVKVCLSGLPSATILFYFIFIIFILHLPIKKEKVSLHLQTKDRALLLVLVGLCCSLLDTNALCFLYCYLI